MIHIRGKLREEKAPSDVKKSMLPYCPQDARSNACLAVGFIFMAFYFHF